MANLRKNLIIVMLFSIIWVCKPIPYERLSYQSDVRHQLKTTNKILQGFRHGGQESNSVNFIPPQYREYQSDTSSGQGQEFSTNPRLGLGAAGNSGSGLGAAGNSGSGGGGGSFDDNDDNNVPPKSEWETNPSYWENYKYNPEKKRSLKKKFVVFQTNLRTRVVLRNYLIAVQGNMFIISKLLKLKKSLGTCGMIQRLKRNFS